MRNYIKKEKKDKVDYLDLNYYKAKSEEFKRIQEIAERESDGKGWTEEERRNFKEKMRHSIC